MYKLYKYTCYSFQINEELDRPLDMTKSKFPLFLHRTRRAKFTEAPCPVGDRLRTRCGSSDLCKSSCPPCVRITLSYCLLRLHDTILWSGQSSICAKLYHVKLMSLWHFGAKMSICLMFLLTLLHSCHLPREHTRNSHWPQNNEKTHGRDLNSNSTLEPS